MLSFVDAAHGGDHVAALASPEKDFKDDESTDESTTASEAMGPDMLKTETTPLELMWTRNKGMHTEESVANGRNFATRPTDVFVATYPKCGTTWMTQICHQLRAPGHMDFEEIFAVCPWDIMALDCGADLDADHVASPRVFKSHEHAGDIARGAKYIHVCRNPEDAFISFYRFLPALVGIDPRSIAMEEFADAIFSGVSHSKGIWEFYASWWERRHDKNVLWVCYEDMRVDLRTQVLRVAKFMGISCDEAHLALVEELSSFKYMATYQRQFDEHMTFDKMRDRMGMPKDYVFGDVDCSKVRSGGGVSGEGKKIPAVVLEMLEDRWKAVMEQRYGFQSYDDLRKAISELNATR